MMQESVAMWQRSVAMWLNDAVIQAKQSVKEMENDSYGSAITSEYDPSQP